ncbi:MAG: hypothetical protein AAFP81_00405 [Pseudomonadota bacterium]
MHLKALSVPSLMAASLIMSAPMADAACDISQTKCAKKGAICSIKFHSLVEAEQIPRNNTGLVQSASRIVIRVKALEDGGAAAGIPLVILPGATKPMLFETHARLKFDKIRISAPLIKAISSSTMSCAEVQAVLNGNARCSVFHGSPPGGRQNHEFGLGYQCDGGKVSGPR